MSHIVLKDQKIYLAHYDLTGDTNSIALEDVQETPDHTTFGQGWRNKLPGLRSFKFSVAGFHDLTALGQDEVIDSKFSVNDVPISVSHLAGLAGEVCRFGPVAFANFESGGTIGDPAEFSLEGELSSYRLVRGQVMVDAATSRTGTFNGTAYQLGAVSSTQKLYAILQVVAYNATSITVKVQSDDNSGFLSATDRITFTAVTNTATRAQFAVPVSGAITDDWWRVIVSAFSGTSASIFAAVGIQT
jgi:hypothetical protein